MKASVDPRLTRLLGGGALEGLRQRLRRRYEQRSLDGQSAKLRLTGLDETEYAALAALLGLPARHRGSVQIDLASLDAAFHDAGIAASLRDALEALDGPLVDRAAEKERIHLLWQEVVVTCEPPLRGWLQEPHGLGLLKRLARRDVGFAGILCKGAAAVLQRLPARGIPRAQLAAETLGDAHALDDGRPLAALVIAVLRSLRSDAEPTIKDETALERRRDTWAEVGVLVNELARPALCLNLPGAAPLGHPAYLSLRWLLRTPVAWEVQGRDIYVCENPNVVAIAADRLGAQCRPLICTEGMPAAAQRTLLGQMVARGARLRYHGDFDWPGVAIGNHVVREFGAHAWRFAHNDYIDSQSKAAQPGFGLRGDFVKANWDPALSAVMQELGTAIPEESVVDCLVQDLAA